MEIKKQNPLFKIFCVGSNLKSLEPANLTNKKNLFFSKFNYLMNKKNKLNAKEIYDYIYDILIVNRPKKYSKYDVWTQILKRNILKKLISCLNKNNLKIYNEIYFQKIRSITRFTFPYLIQLKNEMEKKRLIKLYPYRLEKIIKFKNKFLVQTDKKNFYCDFIINVTSPESVYLLAKKDSLIKSLKRFGDIIKSGFAVDENFQLGNSKIFIPGVHASGFNPDRETIIKAILKNSLISSNYITKSLTND